MPCAVLNDECCVVNSNFGGCWACGHATWSYAVATTQPAGKQSAWIQCGEQGQLLSKFTIPPPKIIKFDLGALPSADNA
eukprot:366068-Chlamydomonas_euryale.AAC.7